MKKAMLLCAGFALVASSAFASGVDLSAVACPGGVGAAADGGTLDCAGAGVVQMYAVFQPGEAASDLAGIDVVMDLQVGGDLATTASFWDFSATNASGLGVNHVRPSTICNAYTAAWSPSGSGEGSLAFLTGTSTERIKALAYRPTNLAYVLNQKLFGMGVLVDGSTSSEAGGGANSGCTLPACLVLNEIDPRTASGSPTQPLTSPASFGNQVTINGGTAAQCLAVPTKKHTWGQLKSLYR